MSSASTLPTISSNQSSRPTTTTTNSTQKNNNFRSVLSSNKRSTLNTIKNSASSLRNTTLKRLDELKDYTVETVGEQNTQFITYFMQIALLIVLLIVVFYIIKYYFDNYFSNMYNHPYLLDGTKNGKRALVISQDPSNASYIPIKKSENQDGIQLTYDFWILIQSFEYKQGEWKHVFHKGNASGYPNRAPGVWIHPDTNSFRIYMNTQENILEYVDIDNIPLRKWIHMSIVLDDKNLDIFINGFLKHRKKLSSVPKQNNGDWWCNMFGGFEGYMSRIRYYSRAISPEEILENVRKGPETNQCIDGSDVPSYFDDDWWYTTDDI